MNIALFSDTYLPNVNGVATSLGLINERFLELGHQVTIFTPKINETCDESDQTAVRIKSIKIRENPPLYIGSPFSLRIFSLFRHEDFDVIHAHTPFTMGVLAYQASLLLKKPLVYTYHTMLPEYIHYLGWLSKTSLARRVVNHFDLSSCRACDIVIAPSVKVKNFLEMRGLSTAVEVVPNGIKVDRFRVAGKDYLRSRPDFEKTDKILLFVGRLGQEKNPLFLIEVLAHVIRKINGVKLVFAGCGYLLPQLRKQAVELQVSSNIVFLGNVPFTDMPALYADADLFVSAATTEVHPMALLEAVGAGKPVVAINDKAFMSAVIHGKNGFLTDLDKQAFANSIVTILQNPALQENMSKESLKLSGRFSIEAQADKLLDIYAGLICR